MIDKFEILSLSKSLNLLPTTIEKDYILGWMLMGINRHPKLKGQWIFKGGTCLKKCYFDQYRFSEDLDFSLLTPEHLDEAILRALLQEVTQWVYNETEILLPVQKISIDIHTNSQNQQMAECKLTYHGPLKQKTNFPRLKLDLTTSEPLILPPEERPILHVYSDQPKNAPSIMCYCYEEIFAEKLRALFERLRPRDLYDVVHLYQERSRLPKQNHLLKSIQKKFDAKKMPLPRLEYLENHAYKQMLPTLWENMLAHQVAKLNSYDDFWSKLPDIFDWLYSVE